MMPIMPKPGTPAFDEFMRKARDPRSIEAGMLHRVVDDTTTHTQATVRQMLHTMIEVVPGQLFRDIGRFHDKFELKPTEDPGHRLPGDVLKFRIKFMYEELGEYLEAVGMCTGSDKVVPNVFADNHKFDAEQAFDALIDLAYVALGTAFLHRFPFNEGWDRVQEANMKKVRASSEEQSKRGSKFDVVKPEGWKPPILADLLDIPTGRRNETLYNLARAYCARGDSKEDAFTQIASVNALHCKPPLEGQELNAIMDAVERNK